MGAAKARVFADYEAKAPDWERFRTGHFSVVKETGKGKGIPVDEPTVVSRRRPSLKAQQPGINGSVGNLLNVIRQGTGTIKDRLSCPKADRADLEKQKALAQMATRPYAPVFGLKDLIGGVEGVGIPKRTVEPLAQPAACTMIDLKFHSAIRRPALKRNFES